MSAEECKAIARRLIEEGYNQGNEAAVDACVALDGVIHAFGGSGPCTPAVEKGWIAAWRTGFPDFRFDILHLLADDTDKVTALLPFTGTHTGPFAVGSQTLEPTGKPIHGWEMLIFRVAEGKIIERWNTWDRLAFLQQLGALSAVVPASP
jgi:hypothetical protein